MALELQYVRINYAAGCKLPPIPKPEIKPMNEAAIAQFMEAVSGDEYERILMLDLYTGLRKSELIGLSWDCVNFDEGAVYLYRQLRYVKGGIGYQFGPLKNGKPRTITPPASAMRLLQEQKRTQNEMRLRAGRAWNNPEGLVFTRGDGSHLCPNTVYEHYKAIVKGMGMPDLRMHDLRHPYVKHTTKKYCRKLRAESVRKLIGYFNTIIRVDGHFVNQGIGQRLRQPRFAG